MFEFLFLFSILNLLLVDGYVFALILYLLAIIKRINYHQIIEFSPKCSQINGKIESKIDTHAIPDIKLMCAIGCHGT